MKKMLVLSAFALFLLMLAAVACQKESSSSNQYLDAAVCTGIDASANTYSNSIKVILDDNCATSSCHDAATAQEGINFSTYATAKSAFESKDCLCAIHHGSGCVPMPQGGAKLDDATLQKIDCWAKNGYQQ